MQITCCKCKKKYSLKIFTPGDCTLFIECPHCGFNHALTFIPFEETIKKIPVKRVVLGGGPAYADLGGTRILSVNGVTDHSGADDANVVDWVKTTELIIAVCIHSAGKDTESSTYKLQWQDDTDGGGYVDLASTGEANYTLGDTSWNHGATVATGDQKCDIIGNDTRQAGERVKDQSLSDAIDLPDEYQSELWFGVDVSGADDSHVYSFQLYSTTEGAAIGVCGATLTIETAAQNFYETIEDNVGITDTLTTKREIKRTLTESVGITDVISTLIKKVVTIADTVGITDLLSWKRNISKTISNTVGITDVLTNKRDIVKSISNNIGITDEIITARTIRKTISNNVGITDVISSLLKKVVLIADTVGITDVVSTARHIHRIFFETVDISDGMTAPGPGGGFDLHRSRMKKEFVHLLMLEAMFYD